MTWGDISSLYHFSSLASCIVSCAPWSSGSAGSLGCSRLCSSSTSISPLIHTRNTGNRKKSWVRWQEKAKVIFKCSNFFMAQIYLSTKLSGFPWCEFLTDKMKAWCLRLNRTLNSQLLTHCFFLFSEILCRCFSVRFSISEMWSARLRSRSLSKLLQGETSSVSSLIVNIFGSNLSEWLSKYLAVFSQIFCKIIIQKV